MMEFLRFIFTDFWHFIGSAILLVILCSFRPVIVDKSVKIKSEDS